MTDELYDPECASCERAQQDYAKLERETDDLVALVQRLARELRRAAPDHDLPTRALDYLKRKGLQGSPFRAALTATPTALTATQPTRCPTCNGDDMQAPCAYPEGGKPGCVRDKRLTTPHTQEE